MKKTPETEVLVYADWHLFQTPKYVGKLKYVSLRGKAVYSFEYDTEWLKTGISIDPSLPLYSGVQYSNGGGNFGIFKDSSPDRWGQLLMKRREILLAKKENRLPKTLHDIDFLLGVHDKHRMGGLRFKISENEDYLSNDQKLAAPPFTSLRELEHAADQYEKDADNIDDTTLKWISQLIAPGSSLGGARPKADITDKQGFHWIAKFPSRKDDSDNGLWELILHDLATEAGIKVPQASVVKLNKSYHTYLSKRFDRTPENKRIHFASAMTLLQHSDGDDADTGVSYLHIASFIKSACANPKKDLEELFRRILFSVSVSNTDDHLRNHGFLYLETGWTLSPAYDINPNPSGSGLKLNISEEDNSLEIGLVMSTYQYYLLEYSKAQKIRDEVIDTVSKWRKKAEKHSASPSEIERMANSFRLK